MFAERKQRRELRRKIRVTSFRARALLPKVGLGLGNPDEVREFYKLCSERTYLERELDKCESRKLIEQATQLAIEIPATPQWWLDDNLDGNMPPEAVTSWLSEPGRRSIAKLVKEERRKNIEWWVKTVTPVFGALISLLGLIIALISISKK